MAEDVGDPAPYQVEQGGDAFLRGEAGQPAAQRVRFGGVRPGGGAACGTGDQGGEQGRDGSGPGCRPEPAEVDLDRDEQRFVQGERRVEQGQALFAADGRGASPGHPPQVGGGERAGHGAAARPQAPGERLGGQFQGTAVLGERVEEGVGGRVVALPGVADRGGRGGEQDEGRQRKVTGEVVQVEGCVDLGPQDVAHPPGGQRLDRPVVQDAGRVDDRAQRAVGGDAGEQRGERVPVGDVTGLHVHPGAEAAQFGGEVGQARGVRAAPADEQQVLYAVRGHEVLCHQAAERAAGPGDEDGSPGRGDTGRCVRGRVRVHGDGGPGEAGGEELSAAYRQLGFRSGQCPGQQAGHGGRVVGVDQQEAVRVLGLGGADEAADRGAGEVGDLLAGCRGDRTPGDEHEPGAVVPPRVGQPVLDEPQGVVQCGVHGCGVGRGRKVRGVVGPGQHGGGRRRSPVQRGTERGQVRMAVREEFPAAEDSPVSEGVGGCGGGHRRPLHPVEGFRAAARAEGVEVDQADGERLDRRDREAVRVGRVDRHRSVRPEAEPYPERGGSGGVQPDSAPGERQSGGRPVRARSGVRPSPQEQPLEGGVQEGGVQAEGGGGPVLVLGQTYLGEDLVTPAPGSGEPAEGGSVAVTGGTEPLVQVVDGDRDGAGRGPGAGVVRYG